MTERREFGEAERLDRSLIYEGSFLDLVRDEVRMPNGRIATREVLHHPGASAVVALQEDGSVVMVEHYRYATGQWLLEVPAGKLSGNEAPSVCAARELEEETGWVPTELRSLGWIWTSPGFTNEKIWLFLARGLQPATQELESDEVLTVTSLPLRRALAMARDGEIVDGKSVCALLRAAAVVDPTMSGP